MNLRLLLLTIGAVAFANTASAHMSHTSVSEAEWNAKSQRFEVSMRLHIVDLENAVSVMTGKKFRLEGNNTASQQLTTYLSKRFAIRSDEGQTTSLHWVGMELELHDVWIYFELEVQPGSPSETTADKATSVEHWDQLFEAQAASSTNSISNEQTALQILNARQLQIESSVLFEVQPEQKNIVSVTIADKTNSVVLVPGKRQDVLDVISKRKWQVGREQQG